MEKILPTMRDHFKRYMIILLAFSYRFTALSFYGHFVSGNVSESPTDSHMNLPVSRWHFSNCIRHWSTIALP